MFSNVHYLESLVSGYDVVCYVGIYTMITSYIINMLLNHRITKFVCCYCAICATIASTTVAISLYIQYNFLNFVDINSSTILLIAVATLLTIATMLDLKNKKRRKEANTKNDYLDSDIVNMFADMELKTANSLAYCNRGSGLNENSNYENSINGDSLERDMSNSNILCDYHYYYARNKDKYSEPYTSGARTILKISSRKNGDLGLDVENLDEKNKENTDVVYQAYQDESENSRKQAKVSFIGYFVSVVKSFNSIFKNVWEKMKTNNIEKRLNEKNEKKKEINDNSNNNNIIINYSDNNGPTDSTGEQVICNQATKIMCYKNSNYSENCVSSISTNTNNNSQLEEKILQKTQEIVDNNNASITKSINDLKTNVNILYDGMQGLIDRMTKMFEVMTVAIQKKM